MSLLLFLINLIFIIYFFVIGVRWLAVLPLVVMLVFLFSTNRDQHPDVRESAPIERVTDFVTENALLLWWGSIVAGGRGIMDLYSNIWPEALLRLIWWHMALWIWSYVVWYTDGKKMFHVGYTLCLVFLWYHWSTQMWWTELLHYILIFVVLSMAMYAFVVMIVWPTREFVWEKNGVGNDVSFLLFVTFNLSIMTLIYLRSRDDLPSAVVLSQIYLMAVYCVIYGVHRYASQLPEREVVDEDTILTDILAGKRILGREYPEIHDIVRRGKGFLDSLDLRTTFVISMLNIVLVLLQVYLFVSGFMSGASGDAMRFTQILFWFGVAAFFVNYLLLREIWFYHELQRAVAFGLINFGIYLSIMSIFWSNVVWMVILGIAWSLINSVLILFSRKLELDQLLHDKDYVYWIGTTAIATLFNVFFILRLPLANQFRISLMFLYLWVQFVFFLYAIKEGLSRPRRAIQR